MIYIKNEIIKAVKEFSWDLYNPNEEPRTKLNAEIRGGPNNTSRKIERALKGIERGKTPEDGIRKDLIMDAGEIATLKLANLLQQMPHQRQNP